MYKYLPRDTTDDCTIVSVRVLDGLERRVMELEEELHEIAEAAARPILAAFKPEVSIVSDLRERTCIIELTLAPVHYRLRLAEGHPLDYTGANSRDAILDSLRDHISQRFAVAIFKQWEATQRHA